MLEQPLDLGRRKVGIEPRPVRERTSGPSSVSRAARIAPPCGDLPDDRAMDRRPVSRSHAQIVSRWFVIPMPERHFGWRSLPARPPP